jgi:hypothetical protein
MQQQPGFGEVVSWVPGARKKLFLENVIGIIKAKCAKLKCQLCEKSDWHGETIACLHHVDIRELRNGDIDIVPDVAPAREYIVLLRCNCGYAVPFVLDDETIAKARPPG